VKTFFGFCLSQEYYSINNKASEKKEDIYLKQFFIKGQESHQSIARSSGVDISKSFDRYLIKNITKSDPETEEETADNIVSMLNRASQWMIKEGINKDKGIIVFYRNASIERELYNNDYYVPSWRVEDSNVFSGYYKNYPMIEIYEPEKAPKCVALNLEGWKGLEIRSEVLEGTFGEINIREWTEDEIEAAISEKKIKREDRNKLKGTCVAEYELYWQLDESNLPDQMTILLQTENPSASTVGQEEADYK